MGAEIAREKERNANLLVNKEAQNQPNKDVYSIIITTLQRMKHWRESLMICLDLSLAFMDFNISQNIRKL